MPLWLAVVLLILTGAGLALCRRYLRGNKTAYILCTLFCVLLALACIVYIGLTFLFVDAVRHCVLPPLAPRIKAAPFSAVNSRKRCCFLYSCNALF